MRRLLIITLLLTSLNFNAQTYSSAFEEKLVKEIQQDSINYNFFASMLAIDSTMTSERALKYQSEVDALISTFPATEDREKKERKRVKNIYDELHDKFFVKYEEDSFFNNIFENGYYNCVTASALYAYAFDKLDIPYHVKETPSHVFLIVYPNTYKIYLETTVPGAYGFLEPSESDIKKIVDELVSYKLVTSQEVLEKGYSKFYEDYFYGKDFVDKKTLIGMQYYNKGILDYQKENHETSINNLKKAKLFFDSPIVKWMLKESMYSQVNNLQFNNKEDIALLLDIIEVSEFQKDYDASNLTSSLSKIVDHDENDKEFIIYVIEEFSKIKNEEVKKISLEYFYDYLARKNARDENLLEAQKYAELLLSVNNDSKRAKQIIEYVTFRRVGLSNFNIEDLKSFESTSEKFQFIKENNRYNIALVSFYNKISYDSFNNKEIELGLDYLHKLENILDTTDVLVEVSKSHLSQLYLKAGNYYYYQSQYRNAYNIYVKGLDYVPKDSDLIKRIGWCKEEF